MTEIRSGGEEATAVVAAGPEDTYLVAGKAADGYRPDAWCRLAAVPAFAPYEDTTP